MRIGILGGTFDPPHLGHLIVATEVQEKLSLDEILFIPAGEPWLKAGQNVTSAEHRLVMTRLATAGNQNFKVSDVEIRRQGPSYTAETLEWAAREFQGSDLFLIMGEDTAQELPQWHRPRRLLELCRLVVYSRPATQVTPPPTSDAFMAEVWQRATLLDDSRIGIASTDLRSRVAAGNSLRYLVPEAVEQYIKKHKLYTNLGETVRDPEDK